MLQLVMIMAMVNINQFTGRMTVPQVRTSQLQQRSVVTTKPIPQTTQRAGGKNS